MAVGSTVGGLVPEAWHASSLGLSAFLGTIVGGLVGVWVAARISGTL